MKTIQIPVDDNIMREADGLFASLGLDTATAVRIFLNAAIENGGIPFPVVHRPVSDSLRQALEDTEKRQNLFGPYDTAEEAVASMLED